MRAWRVGVNIPGLGMRSGGCGCEIQGARGAGGRLYLQRALEVVDLPPSVREELHDGVDCSTPPSRHVGSNHDPCRSMNRQGGFAGGFESRRSAQILRRWCRSKSCQTASFASLMSQCVAEVAIAGSWDVRAAPAPPMNIFVALAVSMDGIRSTCSLEPASVREQGY